MTKPQKKKLIQLLAVAAILIIGSLIPSLGIPGVPGWDAIFTGAGLRGGETDSLPLRVHFIDVGQGDCTLIQSGEANVLIDGGERGNDKNVISYLRNQNVQQIDYLIITHPHSDHIGSLPEIIAQYPPKNVIMTRLSEKDVPTTKIYENLLKAITQSGAAIIAAEPGNGYNIGEAKLEILAPLAQYNELNNMSVVIRVSLGDVAYLFTGDAESKSENAMVASGRNLRADVLKAGHHGSKSSTSADFLAAVRPTVAVISNGQNSYGHPHDEVMKRLAAMGVQVLRTDQRGTIIIATDGKELITKWTKL